MGTTTFQGTNLSHSKGTFEDDFPFPQVGYVNFLEGILMVGWTSRVERHAGLGQNPWLQKEMWAMKKNRDV